jgi:hypothetical protein
MPQPIYPWEQYLPQFLSSMILQNQTMKFREKMLEREEAKTEEAQRIKLATTEGVSELPTEPYAVPPGGNVFTAGGKQYSYTSPNLQPPSVIPIKDLPGHFIVKAGGKIEIVKPEKPEAIKYETITLAPSGSTDTSKHITLRRSSADVDEYLKKGYVEVKAPTTKIDVNMPDTVTPKVKSDLQTAIIDADAAIDALNVVQDPKVFKREYLEYFGKGKAKAAEFGDKFGIDVANNYLKEYTGWKVLVDKQTFAYRKAVTGVAGGEKEMESIQKTYINTSTDSPVMFQKKAQVMKENAMIAKERARYTLDYFGRDWKDLTSKQKQDVSKKFPYITTISLSRAEVADEEAEEYLRSLK